MAGEKTEEATDYRLSNAKKEGKVSKSLEFNAVIMLLALIAVLFVDASVQESFRLIFQYVLQFSRGDNIVENYGSALTGVLMISSEIMLPFFLLFVLTAVISNLLQIGLVFSVKALSPDFSRLDPIKGMKKIFNSKAIYDVFRILMKLSLGYLIFYVWLLDMMDKDINSRLLDDSAKFLSVFMEEFTLLLLFLSGLLSVSAIVDVIYTRKKFSADMKMSKQEVKEENIRIKAKLEEEKAVLEKEIAEQKKN